VLKVANAVLIAQQLGFDHRRRHSRARAIAATEFTSRGVPRPLTNELGKDDGCKDSKPGYWLLPPAPVTEAAADERAEEAAEERAKAAALYNGASSSK